MVEGSIKVKLMGVFKLSDHRLDLKAFHLLKAYHFNPFASVDRVPLSIARQAYERFMTFQAGFLPALYDIENTQIHIGHHKSIRIRIYRSSPDIQPVLLYFHGGGWCIGSLNTHDKLCRDIALAAKCTVVAVDYSLAPENPFPIAINEGYLAYKWCCENIEYLKGIEGNVAVGGDSAGGNIAASIPIQCIDEGYQIPVFQMLLYPPLDLTLSQKSMDEMSEGYFITKKEMQYYIKNYLGNSDPACFQASPLFYHSPEKLPPAVILTAECDPLRDDGRAYASKLKASNTLVSYNEAPGVIHAFIQMSRTFPNECAVNMTWLSREMGKLFRC